MLIWFVDHSLMISAWAGLGATVTISALINVLSWRKLEGEQ